MKRHGISKPNINYDDLYNFDDIDDDDDDEFFSVEDKKLSRPRYNPDNRLRSNKIVHRPVTTAKRSDSVTVATPKPMLRPTEASYKDLYKDKRLLPDINGRYLSQHDATMIANEVRRPHQTRLPDVHMTNGTRHHEVFGPFTPKPPSTAKRTENQRRRNMYRSNQLEQDISVHNPTLNYHKPCTPGHIDLDYDKEIELAAKMQKEFEAYHQTINEFKKSGLKPEEADYQCLLEPSASIHNAASTSETNVDTSRSQQLKPWHAVETRRGVGFKSKAKNDKKVKY